MSVQPSESAKKFAEDIKQAIVEVMPNSTVSVTASGNIVPTINITFAILAKQYWPNNIAENDPFFQRLVIHLDRNTGEIPATFKVESKSAGVFHIIPGPGSYMAFDRLKTGWRDFSVDTTDKAIKRIKAYFEKSKTIIADNIDKVRKDYRAEVAKAVGITEQLTESNRTLRFSEFLKESHATGSEFSADTEKEWWDEHQHDLMNAVAKLSDVDKVAYIVQLCGMSTVEAEVEAEGTDRHVAMTLWSSGQLDDLAHFIGTSERGSGSAYEYRIENTHIDNIKAGDTIMHKGEMKTVSGNNIKITPSGFMGNTSLFGDSYKSGKEPVQKVIFKAEEERARRK